MHLTWRFVLLIAALLGAVAATTVAGLHAMHSLDDALTRVVDNDTPRLLAVTHARRLFRSLGVLERDYILAKEPAERSSLDAKADSLASELVEQLGRYERLAPPEDRQVLEQLRGSRDRMLALSRRVRETALRDPEGALALAKKHAQDPVSWENSIRELVRRSQQRLDSQVAQTHALYVQARRTLLWVSALAALLGAGLGILIFLGIRRMVSELLHLNTHLESLVKARTESLAQRERALRLVLDSTGDGFIEVAHDGRLTGACSAAAVRWFGPPAPEQKLSDYLFPDDPAHSGLFAMAFDQLAEENLPWELSLDQMPRRVTRASTILELDYKRVLEKDSASKFLIVVRDVTDKVHSEAFEQSTREQRELVTRLLRDKEACAQFVDDVESLLSALHAERDLTLTKRHLNALKTKVSLFGLTSLGELCQTVEQHIAETGELPDSKQIADVAALWRLRLSSIENFLTAMSETRLELEKSEHDRLILTLLDRPDAVEIVNMVEVWSWPRTVERLARLRANAEHLAKRLQRLVEVTVTDNGLRAPRDYLEKLWPTLIHVVRSAIDLGVETEAERIASGKPRAMQLELISERGDAGFVIGVRDDGRGLDRNALLRAARALDPSLREDTSLEELLFMDSLSPRSQSTPGSGMAAVREACLAEGGRIEVSSAPGLGTTLALCVPRAERAAWCAGRALGAALESVADERDAGQSASSYERQSPSALNHGGESRRREPSSAFQLRSTAS